MRFIVLILVGMLWAIPVIAQPNFRFAETPVGKVVKWRAHNGNTQVTMVGRERGLYVLDFKRDGSKGAPLKVRLYANRDGEIVRAKGPDFTQVFSPSDCSLHVGRCKYTERLGSGQSRRVIWTASVRDGVWSYKKFHTRERAENLIEEGKFTVDEFGYYINRDYRYKSNGRWVKGWSRRR